MPISIRQIADRIRECGWTCDVVKRDDGVRICHASFHAEHYRNPNGDEGFHLYFTAEHEGRTLLATVENVYQLESRAHLGATCETMLRVCDGTDLCQFELFDDGEAVRLDLVCELPVEDGTLTAGQLRAVVGAMGSALDNFHEPLVCATKRGVVDANFFRGEGDDQSDTDGDGDDDSADSSGAGLQATDSVDIDVPGVSDASQREIIEQAIREAGGVEELLRLVRRARRDEGRGGR